MQLKKIILHIIMGFGNVLAWRSGMKRFTGFFVIGVALALVSCGNSAGPEKTGPSGAVSAARKAAAARPAARPVDFLRLSAVRISPANPTAATDLSAEALVAPPVPDGIEFQYRWIVNDKEVAESAGAVLSCSNFKKKQWVYCQVKALSGEKTSDWLQSKHVRIANSSPQLESSAVEDFSVPGLFTFQITATDPDLDALTFELLSPLDQGIVVDAKTGALTWKLDEVTVKRLGENIEIKFAVSDGDQGKTSGSIILNLTKPK
jgi:hypothetical protein